jgi:AcrR family transcriptional regulator
MMNSTGDEIRRQARGRRRSGDAVAAGRRAGDSGTRDAILQAARRQFSELGYDRTTVRGIAAEAGVDPALVAHFYGPKQQLFMAAVELPFDPAAVIPELLAGDRDAVGRRLAAFVVGVMESPEGQQRLLSLIRAATAEPEAARLIRELIARELFQPMVVGLGTGDADLRAALIGANVVGLFMARHVVALAPMAALGADELTATYAPIFQRILVEPLGA